MQPTTYTRLQRHRAIRDYLMFALFGVTAIVALATNNIVVTLLTFAPLSLASAVLYSVLVRRSDRKHRLAFLRSIPRDEHGRFL